MLAMQHATLLAGIAGLPEIGVSHPELLIRVELGKGLELNGERQMLRCVAAGSGKSLRSVLPHPGLVKGSSKVISRPAAAAHKNQLPPSFLLLFLPITLILQHHTGRHRLHSFYHNNQLRSLINPTRS